MWKTTVILLPGVGNHGSILLGFTSIPLLPVDPVDPLDPLENSQRAPMTVKKQCTGPFFPQICNERTVRPSDRFYTLKTIFSRFVEGLHAFFVVFNAFSMVYIEVSIYTMDIHGTPCLTMVNHLKTKKYHNSTQSCLFSMIFGPK